MIAILILIRFLLGLAMPSLDKLSSVIDVLTTAIRRAGSGGAAIDAANSRPIVRFEERKTKHLL